MQRLLEAVVTVRPATNAHSAQVTQNFPSQLSQCKDYSNSDEQIYNTMLLARLINNNQSMKQNKIYKLPTLANFITSISFRFEIFHIFLLTILHILSI